MTDQNPRILKIVSDEPGDAGGSDRRQSCRRADLDAWEPREDVDRSATLVNKTSYYEGDLISLYLDFLLKIAAVNPSFLRKYVFRGGCVFKQPYDKIKEKINQLFHLLAHTRFFELKAMLSFVPFASGAYIIDKIREVSLLTDGFCDDDINPMIDRDHRMIHFKIHHISSYDNITFLKKVIQKIQKKYSADIASRSAVREHLNHVKQLLTLFQHYFSFDLSRIGRFLENEKPTQLLSRIAHASSWPSADIITDIRNRIFLALKRPEENGCHASYYISDRFFKVYMHQTLSAFFLQHENLRFDETFFNHVNMLLENITFDDLRGTEIKSVQTLINRVRLNLDPESEEYWQMISAVYNQLACLSCDLSVEIFRRFPNEEIAGKIVRKSLVFILDYLVGKICAQYGRHLIMTKDFETIREVARLHSVSGVAAEKNIKFLSELNEEDFVNYGKKAAMLSSVASFGHVPDAFCVSKHFSCEELRGYDYREEIKKLEDVSKKKFGKNLLVSIRSGASISFPGSMRTILNVGINLVDRERFIALQGEEAFYRQYNRFLMDWLIAVEDVPEEEVKLLVDGRRSKEGNAVLIEYIRKRSIAIPRDAGMLVRAGVIGVKKSWDNQRTAVSRRVTGMMDTGTAVMVQKMASGLGETSGSGVAFSRMDGTENPKYFIEYLNNAQGVDIVSGEKNVFDSVPDDKKQDIIRVMGDLTQLYQCPVELEFTIDNGELNILQFRNQKKAAFAYQNCVEAEAGEEIFEGVCLHQGLVKGKVIFHVAAEESMGGEKIFLGRRMPYISGSRIKAVVTARWNYGSHQMMQIIAEGVPAVGVPDLKVIKDDNQEYALLNGCRIQAGDELVVGLNGKIFFPSV